MIRALVPPALLGPVARAKGAETVARAPEPAETPQVPSDLDRRFLDIAEEVEKYGIVDTKFSWAQLLWRVYNPPARYSSRSAAETHGGKLYQLCARDWDADVKGIHERQPVGQAIVKEPWEARPATKTTGRGSDSPTSTKGRPRRNPVPFAPSP